MSQVKYVHTERMHNPIAAEEILPYIFRFKNITSAIDVGCGNGSWLKAVKGLGVKEDLGIDGIQVSPNEMNIEPSEFCKKNLTSFFDLEKKYDLLISLEVAEHLPENAANTFIKSLTNHSDYILFSAAIPGQGGQYHINEQWPNYWNEKFIENGYEAYDILRNHFWNNKNVFWWYKQNMILYVKQNSGTMTNFKSNNYVSSIVHPDLYNKKTTKPKYLSNKERLIEIKNIVKSFIK
jgi:hypothetical protein